MYRTVHTCVLFYLGLSMLSLGGGGVAVGRGEGFCLKPKTFVKCLGVGHQLSVTSVKYSINNNYTLIIIITHLNCTGHKTITLN